MTPHVIYWVSGQVLPPEDFTKKTLILMREGDDEVYYATFRHISGRWDYPWGEDGSLPFAWAYLVEYPTSLSLMGGPRLACPDEHAIYGDAELEKEKPPRRRRVIKRT